MCVFSVFFMRFGPDFSHDFLLEKIFFGAWETKCWTKSLSDSHNFFKTFFFSMFLWHYFTFVSAGFGKVLLAPILGGTSKSCVYEKIYTSIFSIRTPITLRMQVASSRFWHNARSLASSVPNVKPRRVNTSLFMLLKVEWTLEEPKSLGLNWNRQSLYIRNGMNCNNTCSRRSYM